MKRIACGLSVDDCWLALVEAERVWQLQPLPPGQILPLVPLPSAMGESALMVVPAQARVILTSLRFP